MINIIEGDLLESDELFIVHQCNCVSKQSKGLAKTIFERYPETNVYQFRTRDNRTHSCPGTVNIFQVTNKNNNKGFFIINLYGQVYPGKPRYGKDSSQKRLEYFGDGLMKISELLDGDIKSIAMPYNIGCGLGGGNWEDYLKIITKFSESSGIKINLYKK